jgi:hypothetical protein
MTPQNRNLSHLNLEKQGNAFYYKFPTQHLMHSRDIVKDSRNIELKLGRLEAASFFGDNGFIGIL